MRTGTGALQCIVPQKLHHHSHAYGCVPCTMASNGIPYLVGEFILQIVVDLINVLRLIIGGSLGHFKDSKSTDNVRLLIHLITSAAIIIDAQWPNQVIHHQPYVYPSPTTPNFGRVSGRYWQPCLVCPPWLGACRQYMRNSSRLNRMYATLAGRGGAVWPWWGFGRLSIGCICRLSDLQKSQELDKGDPLVEPIKLK